MAGHASVAVLQKLEIRTIGDLAQMDPAILTLHLKSHGKNAGEYANGVDNSALESEPSQAKGIGNSTTLASDLTTAQEAYPILLQLSTKVGKRLEKAGQSANNLCVEIKYATFEKSDDHDIFQFCINFIEGPGQTLGVLGHLECGCCNTTCICSFSRCEDYAVLLQIFGCFQSSRHVSALAYCSASVLNKCFCILKQQLVLSCARKSKVCFYNPYAASFVVLRV